MNENMMFDYLSEFQDEYLDLRFFFIMAYRCLAQVYNGEKIQVLFGCRIARMFWFIVTFVYVKESGSHHATLPKENTQF